MQERTAMEIGLFGGSFNPPHVGHVLAVVYALAVGAIDRVVVVPVFHHSLGKNLAPFGERLAMTRLAFAGIDAVEVTDIEASLSIPSRTLRTLNALRERHRDAGFRLIVGSDILNELDQWHAIDEIKRLAPLLVLPRTGEGAREPLLPRVSSTEVRGLVGDWLSAEGACAAKSEARLRECVPRRVLDYIQSGGVYRTTRSP